MIEQTQDLGGERQASGRAVTLSSILLLLLFLGITLFSSPIFRVLGFEYATLTSLTLSFVVGVFVAARFRGGEGTRFFSSIGELLPAVILMSAVPLAIGIMSAIFIPNCALLDGIGFYIVVAVPGALLGMLFGAAAALIANSQRLRIWLFLLFWIGSFVYSLLPGYTNPQIFTYGWQYGFFPGIVWDSALELTSSYYFFRVENFAGVGLLLYCLSLRAKRRHERVGARNLVLVVAWFLALVAASEFHGRFRITSDVQRVEHALSGAFVEHAPIAFTIRYAPGSFTSESFAQVRKNVRWYLYDLRTRLGLKDSSMVTVFIYPSTDAMYDCVGTRDASISKPWLHQVHIAKENLGSLKHELTHVVLAEVGAWPFRISWSTGITEGIAMAQEFRYDGLRTLDEHAAHILQMHLATGVQDVMSFSGFASNASQKSYVLAGSFATYLLKNYGAPAYVRLYTSLDYEKEYHHSLPELEEEWKHSLAIYETPMDPYDSLRTSYFFGGSSILFEPCLRRIGKLDREAHMKMQARRFLEADSIYALIVREAGSVSALSGRAIALMDAGNYAAAKAVLDTTRGLDPIKMRAALEYLRADVEFRNGDTNRAALHWAESARQKINDQVTVGSMLYSKLVPVALSAGGGVGWKEYFDTIYRGATPETKQKMLDAIQRKLHADSLAPYMSYLYAGQLLRDGHYSAAIPYLEGAVRFTPRSSEDSLIVFAASLQLRAFGYDVPHLAPPYFMRNAAKLEVDEIDRRDAYYKR